METIPLKAHTAGVLEHARAVGVQVFAKADAFSTVALAPYWNPVPARRVSVHRREVHVLKTVKRKMLQKILPRDGTKVINGFTFDGATKKPLQMAFAQRANHDAVVAVAHAARLRRTLSR